MSAIIEPRAGDTEDDASSTKTRGIAALAGSLLTEISLPKLVLTWITLVLLPALLLGLVPLVATAWLSKAWGGVTGLSGIGALLLLALIAAIGWCGVRPLRRIAERSFWSLNSIIVQPGYALGREALRHLAERFIMRGAGEDRRAKLRATVAIGAGLAACAVGVGIAVLVLPWTRWTGGIADLAQPQRLVIPAIANSAFLLAAYIAVASLAWGVADATAPQARDLLRFDDVPPSARRWRVAHLSDIHVVGERYGFRLDSGRAGPRGNDHLGRILEALDGVHADAPLDFVLITGDITDAGRSSEWAEFFDALSRYPALAERTFIVPGNHDVNIVDRANPARLELPSSPGKRLRQMRTLSAAAAIQGHRVRVFDRDRARFGSSLSEMLEPHREAIATFADTGSTRLSAGLARLWSDAFPMVMPPADEEGLGIIFLDSNAETHFSFTNALGLVSERHIQAMCAGLHQYPRARWIIALHHHLVEYPKPAKKLSERIGTVLINGSRFVRQIEPASHRVIAMHGHRHIDWVGRAGRLKIVSAPSTVMDAVGDKPTRLYVHTLAAAEDGGIALLQPQRVELASAPSDTIESRPFPVVAQNARERAA